MSHSPVKMVQVEDLWQRQHCVEKFVGFGSRILPIQVECEHFWRISHLAQIVNCMVTVINNGAVLINAFSLLNVFGIFMEALKKLALDSSGALIVALILHDLQALQQSSHVNRFSEEVG